MSTAFKLSIGEIEALLQASNPDVFDIRTEEGTKAAVNYQKAVLTLNARLKRLRRQREGDKRRPARIRPSV